MMDLRVWLKGAQAGESAIYFSGYLAAQSLRHPDRLNGLAAQGMARQGLVYLTQRRRAGKKTGFDYLVTKAKAPNPDRTWTKPPATEYAARKRVEEGW